MNRREKGVALLLVLGAVALLSSVAVELASRASADSLRVTRSIRDASLRRLSDSGAEIVRGLLVEPEPTDVTHWGQSWNREVRFDLGPGENAWVRVADESGKLNIARALLFPDEAAGIQAAVQRLFDYLARHESTNALFWRDVEEKVLRRLSLPEPILTLDGLREAGLDLSQISGLRGVSRYLTCFGSGAVNLNTAPRAVLAALDVEFDDAMVERIARYRGRNEGDPGTYKPFSDPQDLMLVEGIVNRTVGTDGNVRIVRNLYEKVKGRITVKSDCFSGSIQATAGGHAREAWIFMKPSGSRLAFEELLP